MRVCSKAVNVDSIQHYRPNDSRHHSAVTHNRVGEREPLIDPPNSRAERATTHNAANKLQAGDSAVHMHATVVTIPDLFVRHSSYRVGEMAGA